MKVSVVIPVYKCPQALEELVNRIESAIDKSFEKEIILVNDGCPQESWIEIKRISKDKPYLKGLNLSRNFGQHYAIQAGLEYASGEWIVVMDCDLQDSPEEIPRMLDKTREGYDIVLARRELRQDSTFKRVTSKWFYKLLGYLTSTEQDPSIANFGVYHTNAIKSILSMGDYVRYFPTMVKWVGFNWTSIDVAHGKREVGKSSYTFKSLFRLGLNVIISFSDRPLRLIIRLGLLICSVTIIAFTYFFIKYLAGEIGVSGWTSLILSIWFFGGVIITLIGSIGLYIGKIFDQVKNRPRYIIKDQINTER